MKIILSLIGIVIWSNVGFSQINDLPDIKEYVWFDEGGYDYNDTIPRDKFRDHGNPHIIYENLNDTIVRKEYFKNGRIRSIAQITHEYIIDTTAYRDVEDDKYKIIILKRLNDEPNGSYIEYQEWNNKIQSKGKCNNGKRIGTWEIYQQNGDKIIANFNNSGQLDGEYKEYYYNRRDNTYTLKIEGKFAERNYEFSYKSGKTGKLRTSQRSEIRRIDEWKYYSEDGSLLEVVNYNWKKD